MILETPKYPRELLKIEGPYHGKDGVVDNLFDPPEHRDRVRWMAARLRLWQREVGDTTSLQAV